MFESLVIINGRQFIIIENDNQYSLILVDKTSVRPDENFNGYFLEGCYFSYARDYLYFVINEKNEVKTVFKKGDIYLLGENPGLFGRERLEDKERFPYGDYVPYCSLPSK